MFTPKSTTMAQMTNFTFLIDCPACGKDSVPSVWVENQEVLKLFHLIPIYTHRTIFVTCGACRRQLISKISIDDAARMSAKDISLYLTIRESLVGKFLALTSVALFWAPMIGPVLGILGIFMNRRSVAWARTLSWTATVLSLLLTAAILLLMAFE